MPLVCLSCTQDLDNPCYGVLFYFDIPSGSTITETDNVKVVTQATQSTIGEIEIAPFINENSVGDLYYQFNIILNGSTYNFVVYKNGAQWILAKNDDSNYTNWATSTGDINDTCVFDTTPLTWTPSSGDDILPNFNIDRVEKAVLSAPSNNEDTCSPPINVPIKVSNKTIPLRIDELYKCLDVKGTEYLNKLKGGIPCSNLELTKLSLIIELLKKRDCETALPCLYNRRDFNITLYKGDFCSDINAISGNSVTIPGNFIGYAGANFVTSCAPIPAYDYLTPVGVCNQCPTGYAYDLNSINSQEVCIQSTTANATTSPLTPASATIVAGTNDGAYNQGGLNLLRPINVNTITLPITFSGNIGAYTFKDGNGTVLQGDTGFYTDQSNSTNYALYSRQGTDGFTATYQFVQANNPLFSSRSDWNTTDTSYGMLNYSGVWLNNTNANCTGANLNTCDQTGKNITIFKCLSIPQSEGEAQYLLGLSADDAIKIDIKGTGFGDGETFIELIRLSTTTLQHHDGFTWYHVIPITINPGNYTLRIRGYNYSNDSVSAISVDIFKMSIIDFKLNFCNNNLPAYSNVGVAQAIVGNTFPTGNVTPANLANKRAQLFNSTNCIFSLGAPDFANDLIGTTVFTEAVNFSCPLGAEIDYCSGNGAVPVCSTITNTIPYYDCCYTGECQDKFEGLSNEIINVEYNPDLDISTLYLADDFPIGPGNTCINYCISYTPTPETYLETFLNYIGKECSSCITKLPLNNTYSNFDEIDVVPPATEQGLTDQSGGSITLENGLDIIL